MDPLIAPRFRPVQVLIGLAVTLLLAAVVAGSASAASVVGPDGLIHGCYVKKGKAKGTLRVVPNGKRCKKREKRVAWNAQGQSGQTGQSGAQGGSSQATVTSLQDRVTQLQDRVTQLESILAGVTNPDLLGALASVDSLCTEVGTAVVPRLNDFGTVLTTPFTLSGTLLGLGTLSAIGTDVPAALPGYSCP